MNRRFWVSMGLTACLVTAIAPLVALRGWGATLLDQKIQDFGHVPLFALIALLLLLMARHLCGSSVPVVFQYLVAFVVAILLGALTEWVQMLGPRDADLWDLARDAVGAAMALLMVATFDRRLDGTSLRGPRARHGLRLAAVAGFIAFLVPLISVAVAYRDRATRFPVLFSFETRSERLFMNKRLSWYEFVPAPEAWTEAAGEQVAHITFSPLGDGALIFNEPHADWSGRSALVFEFFHPGNDTLEFGLRVDDRQRNVLYVDRFNRHVFLKPGFNRLRIPMAEIVSGPVDRELDISRISRIVIFPVEPVGGYEIYLGRVLLEGDSTLTSSSR